jgi:hypothetical protein
VPNPIKIKNILYIVFIFLFLSSCTSHNKAYRTGDKTECHTSNECNNAFIEQHKKDNYDLAFIEYSERGNVFSRERLSGVIRHIEAEEKNPSGIMVIVYVHGWKHNASLESNNVRKFRKLLKTISKKQLSNRKVIGVYVGWRGETFKHEPLKTLTYWGRKNVARQVGSGGVSELLLKLNKITSSADKEDKNILAIAGHSFGGAIILSAMKDILINHLINTEKVNPTECGTKTNFQKACSAGCYKTKNFADGILLLNPAVEANELLQIKELVTEERCYAKNQQKLLHILSSNADKPNKYAFRIGQTLGVSIRERESRLKRKIFIGDTQNKKDIEIDEHELDVTTVGNYQPFITGKSTSKKNDLKNIKPANCTKETEEQIDEHTPCQGTGECVSKKYKNKNFPSSPYEPISIVSTDAKFINSHSDIFNENVIAYMITAVLENQNKKSGFPNNNQIIKDHCYGKSGIPTKFNFKNCTNFFRRLYVEDFCNGF